MFMLRQLRKSINALARAVLNLPQSLLQLIRRFSRRPGQRQSTTAGFVLPTVTMVTLVVILTSATLVVRSIDRAKNASNFRVNQVVMNAAAPAVERAKAKINALFEDSSLPRGTPSDAAVTGVFSNDRYDLDDEIRLQVAYDFGDVNGNLLPDGNLQDSERITTAWRFPVDTDNNGKYDSFTLYGVYYLSATSRARTPVEARTRPQVLNAQSQACEAAAGTSASLVGNDGWFDQEGVLKKAFYVYVTNVPITSLDPGQGFLLPTKDPYNDPNEYEVFNGNRGFTAMEYQQDRARIPLGNNAVVYEDDLDLSSGTDLRINGRIITNSNLLGGERQNNLIRLYQVSSDESCFYDEENGKILVGGNVRIGSQHDNRGANRSIQADFFQGRKAGVGGGDNGTQGISGTNSSVAQNATDVSYDNRAYEDRLDALVNTVIAIRATPADVDAYKNDNAGDPQPVRDAVAQRVEQNPALGSELERLRAEELRLWFRNRTRRVPRAEANTNPGNPNPLFQEYGTDNLRPNDAWILPTEGITKLAYRKDYLPAYNPETAEGEKLLGDRVKVGNNLPALWWDNDKQRFATDRTNNFTDLAANNKWWQGTSPSNTEEARYRRTQTQRLDTPGATSRSGFWETSAAQVPAKKNEAVGGLRVVTGAGIYLPAEVRAGDNPFFRAAGRPRPEYVVWPDTMPQPPNPIIANPERPNASLHPYRKKLVERYITYNGERYPVFVDDEDPVVSHPDLVAAGMPLNEIVLNATPKRPYLKMRASVVYHYSFPDDPIDPDPSNDTAGRIPIACVSSFYDPTDWQTAQNWRNLNVPVSGLVANNTNTIPLQEGFSNNGVTYAPRRNSYTVNFNDDILKYQADLVYPNGRPVNGALKKALNKSSQTNLTLADRAAIDAAYCGLDILSGAVARTEVPTSGFPLVNGAIQELAFLDGRQVQSLEKPKRRERDSTTSPYVDAYTLQQPKRDVGQRDFQVGSEPNYDLQIENRLPLEIRTTVIDLKKLRLGNGSTALRVPDPTAPQVSFPDREFMLPMSGIIYATRDDALPDASNRPVDAIVNNADPILALMQNEPTEQDDQISPVDYWLDPTRRPNGIMLINGRELNRDPGNLFIAEGEDPNLSTEKGLTLASNLPVYIKAEPAANGDPNNRPGFNVHEKPSGGAVEEFQTSLDADWGNFYSRTEGDLDVQFACHRGDPRLPKCTEGDKWRAANILSDAMTLLSERYRFGFRNEGDYDIRNNQADNLFRDPFIRMGDDSTKRLHAAFNFDDDALLPANYDMAYEYANTTVDFDGTDFANNYIAIEPRAGSQKNINNFRINNGFRAHESYAINGLSSNSNTDAFVTLGRGQTDDGYATPTTDRNAAPLGSSYFNNFISPVQRRLTARTGKLTQEYLMETCLKLPVSQCVGQVSDQVDNWVVSAGINGSDVLSPTPSTSGTSIADSGSTQAAPSEAFQHFPRRVAFLRYTSNMDLSTLAVDGTLSPKPVDTGNGRPDSGLSNYEPGQLILDRSRFPIPLAINQSGNIMCHTYRGLVTFEYTDGRSITCRPFQNNSPDPDRQVRESNNNILWYAPAQPNGSIWNGAVSTNNVQSYDDNLADRPIGIRNWNTSDSRLQDLVKTHPTVVPVSQLNTVDQPGQIDSDNQQTDLTNWLQRSNTYAENIHFNLVMATGDTPPRFEEENGSVSNLPRFLESWSSGGVAAVTEIKGSFIQLQRSAYATGPFHALYNQSYNFNKTDANLRSLLGYRQKYPTGSRNFSNYTPPGRQWGFDVGMLSQRPDLFSQQFGLPSTDAPNEFYREASRRDDWVQTLLCAVAVDPNDLNRTTGLSPVINRDQRPTNFCQTNARAPY